MKFEKDILYIWVGGSCDYGHEERAGGGAYIAEIFDKDSKDGSGATVVDTFTCTEFGTTEFRMMLKSMIHAMEKFSSASESSIQQNFTKIAFLSNVQYLLNFDKKPASEDVANADLIEQCIALKAQFESVTARILPYHKYPQQQQVHEMASNAMRKLRNG